MIIKCIRCGKEINHPNDSNSDYIMAADTIVEEGRMVLVAVQFTEVSQMALEEVKRLERAALKVPDDIRLKSSERNRIVITSAEDANRLLNIEKIEAEEKVLPIQKTGVVCPECYRVNDILIWGLHKKEIR